MELTHYLKTYPCADKPGRVLAVATRRCAVLELSEGLLEKARTGDLGERERDTLARLGVLVPDRAGEREEMRRTFETINGENRHFAALVTLTLECNLACGYCFEDPFRGRFVMADDTAGMLVQRLTEQMAAGRDVTVDFYGGEALMALPLLQRIAGRLGEAARTAGVVFRFNIISNATLLTRPVVQELLPLGLAAVKLTLDGPRDIHDRQRPFVSGKGSFDTIVANIGAVHDLVPVDLGGNYTRDNYRRFPEMLDYLTAQGIAPEKLKTVGFAPVIPKADGTVSGDFGTACASTSEPWMIEASLFLRQETIRRGFPVPKLRAAACMIEFEHDLVVAYDGSLYKCPAFMGREELRIGSLAEGVGDYAASHNLDVWKNDECLECAYLPICFGGCRFLSLLRSGAIEGVDCRRAYLDTALEQLVRQDLAMGRPKTESRC
ncbi:putative geopeptide radical SAM maturase [Geobacter sp. FeAm09]|uniref:geopeptide radical SAM maturase n=1 Tax=Geobacter sp. FeAm09 TaxID=2597769 RepID=UPI0011ED4411|nr:geopeptide radical SAM maturase [Geobacter sp. FeAm09]QEM68047.1 putative geopeptide radical SAM maturase [Geobacter sp. FeAm09]